MPTQGPVGVPGCKGNVCYVLIEVTREKEQICGVKRTGVVLPSRSLGKKFSGKSS